MENIYTFVEESEEFILKTILKAIKNPTPDF
jgi:hypothetical protein